MSYNKKITFYMLFFITLLVNGILYILLDDRVSYTPVVFEDISSRFPSHLKISNHEKHGWRGITAANSSKSKWVYMLKKPHEAGRKMKDYFHRGTNFRRLRIDENLYFGIIKRGKNYRLYVYVFVLQNYEYWVESGCSYSSLLSVKEMADTILENFEIQGSRPFKNIKEITKKTTGFVSPHYSQSLGFLMAIITAAMVFNLVVPVIIFYFSGLAPAQRPGGIVKEFTHVSVRISSSKWKSQSIDGYVASSGSSILVYLFKKLNAIVPFAELEKPGQVKVAKTRLFKQDYISFSFFNTSSVFPKRKSPVKKAKIILYLQHDRIRELLLATAFPFKEKLSYGY